MTKSRWVGLSIGLVLILAAFGVMAWQSLTLVAGQSVALAQGGPTATPPASPSNPSTAPTVTTSSIGDAFWVALAAKLGVSADTLKADAVQVRKDMLDQAVKDGRVTQAEADQLKQKIDANSLIAPIYIGPGNRGTLGPKFQGPANRRPFGPGFRGIGPGRGFGFGYGFGAAQLEAVAKVLNLSATDLVNQLSSGKTLADVATAQNVDQAKVKQAIIDSRKAEIDREVADGLITQAQANTLESRLTPDNIDLTRKPFFFGFR